MMIHCGFPGVEQMPNNVTTFGCDLIELVSSVQKKCCYSYIIVLASLVNAFIAVSLPLTVSCLTTQSPCLQEALNTVPN